MTNKTTSAIDLVMERVNKFVTCGCCDDDWPPLRRDIADTITRLQAALTPSAETKAAFIGDFKFDVPLDGFDEDGEQLFGFKSVTVPWDTIKEIMAAIREHASSVGGE